MRDGRRRRRRLAEQRAETVSRDLSDALLGELFAEKACVEADDERAASGGAAGFQILTNRLRHTAHVGESEFIGDNCPPPRCSETNRHLENCL